MWHFNWYYGITGRLNFVVVGFIFMSRVARKRLIGLMVESVFQCAYVATCFVFLAEVPIVQAFT